MLLKSFLLISILLIYLIIYGTSNIVDSSLKKSLLVRNSANILISLKTGTVDALRSISNKKFTTRTAKLNTVANVLRSNAKASQANLLKFLQSFSNSSVQYESFWISNQIFIKNADLSLVNSLESFEEVSEIYEEEIIKLDAPLKIHKIQTRVNDLKNKTYNKDEETYPEWNLRIIKAPGAWDLRYFGQGIVVGNIDTGVRYSHRSLRYNYLGDYGWYDPYHETPLPNDDIGHGTHTMGIMVGLGGFGVAPSALWSACKGCYHDLCVTTSLIKCGQFLLCPTKTDFTDPDCSKAPHVINCSWGGGRNNQKYHPVIDAWRAAGIIPVFSNGNTGPNCDTARSPADYPLVIGVGATTNKDELAVYSALGPTVNNTIKPDIVAPGSGVLSCSHTGDDDYILKTGTSMAAPHVAGAIAILKSRNPQLEFDEIYEYLRQGADQNLINPGKNCGGIDESVYPNHEFGHGRLNCENSLKILIENESKHV